MITVNWTRDAVDYRDGHLHARPHALAAMPPPLAPGEHRLALVGGSSALFYVPRGVQPRAVLPLVVMLHGAGAKADQGVALLRDVADERGLLVLAPKSHASTWDVIADEAGPDVAALDDALAQVFARARVDKNRIVIGGFSDGASCALSLGVANGDLFTSVLAFSPGFMAHPSLAGRPRFFVSHGTKDGVLPISCSRQLVSRLRRTGYDVRYEEFDGGHGVPTEIARAAVEWSLGPPQG